MHFISEHPLLCKRTHIRDSAHARGKVKRGASPSPLPGASFLLPKVAEKRRGQLKLCLGREGVDCFGDLSPLLSTCQRVLDQMTKLEFSAEGSTSTIIKTRSRSGSLSRVTNNPAQHEKCMCTVTEARLLCHQALMKSLCLPPALHKPAPHRCFGNCRESCSEARALRRQSNVTCESSSLCSLFKSAHT